MIRWLCLCVAFSVSLPAVAQPPINDRDVSGALLKATKFMASRIAVHGGYACTSSADGSYSNGEGVAGPQRVWVQPPGTPAVGFALLDAYTATGDDTHLKAARAVGDALIAGQLRSGGWGYSIEFDPAARANIPYRVEASGSREKIAPSEIPSISSGLFSEHGTT